MAVVSSPFCTQCKRFTFKNWSNVDLMLLVLFLFLALTGVFVNNLHREQARETPDLCEPTSRTDIHCLRQQIQSKAHTESICDRQKQKKETWGGEGVVGGVARAIAEHPLCQRIKHQAW